MRCGPPRRRRSREHSLGKGAGPGRAAFKPLPPDTPRDRPAPPLIGSAAGTAAFLLAALPRCPAPSRWWFRCGRCRGLGLRVGSAARVPGARAGHGAAAAAAPAAAALPRLAAPPGETPRQLPPPGELLGRGVSPAAACLGGGREGGQEGRSAPRAVGRLQRFIGTGCPRVGTRGVTALARAGQVASFALN